MVILAPKPRKGSAVKFHQSISKKIIKMKKIFLMLIAFAMVCGKAQAATFPNNVSSIRDTTLNICGLGKRIGFLRPQIRTGTPMTGVWSVDLPGIASISATTGDISILGVSAGRAVISFTGNGLYSSFRTYATVTVLDTAHVSISGLVNVCVGSRTTLDVSPRKIGNWHSSNNSIATIGALAVSGGETPGSLNGVADGNVTISFGYTNTCGTFTTTRIDSIHARPNVSFTEGTGHRYINGSRYNHIIYGGTPDINANVFAFGGFTSRYGCVTFAPASTPADNSIQYANFAHLPCTGCTEAITYTYTDRHNCSGSQTQTISFPASKGEDEAGEEGAAIAGNSTGLKVFPNPSTGIFTITIPEVNEGAQVIISDMQGKVVSTRNTAEKIVSMDLSHLPAGNYTVSVFAGDKKYSEKVVKE
jgi:hypothetical protein